MSGGGGGIIIIRQKVRETGELDVVKDAQTPARRAHLCEILQKPNDDWTESDFDFVQKCISHAHDETC